VWTEACEKAFLDIKSRHASRPILQPPNHDLLFLMAVDLSDVTVAACLFKKMWMTLSIPFICFLNKKLNKHQRNYSTDLSERGVWFIVCH